MSEEMVICGVDTPEAEDFTLSEQAKALRGMSPRWLIWLVALAQPLAILGVATLAMTYIANSLSWQLYIIEHPSLSVFQAFVVGLVSWCVSSFLCFPLLHWRRHKKKDVKDERWRVHRFAASEASFETENDDVRIVYKWSSFDDVTRYKDAHILWRQDQLRYFLPVRAFASSADAERFFELAKRRIVTPSN